MLQQSTLQFIKQLKKNNNKEWFESNRKKYDAAKADFALLVQFVIDDFCKTDVSIETIKAKDCLFRINRDIRFTKDKSPYKTNFGASISAGGKKSMQAGYYIHFEPGQSFAGGGMYDPSPEALQKVRQEIDYNFKEFEGIINNKKFKAVFKDGLSSDKGLSLSRPPKGYDENNPAIKYLKLKSFIAFAPLTDEELTSSKIVSTITNTFKALHPIISFLNNSITN